MSKPEWQSEEPSQRICKDRIDELIEDRTERGLWLPEARP